MATLLLTGLVAHGAVETRDERGIYHLGPGFAFLVPREIERLDLRRLLSQAVQRIAELIQDSVYLSLRAGFNSLCIAYIESSHLLKTLALRVGDNHQLGVGAGALALPAFLPQAEADRIRDRCLSAGAAFGFDEITLFDLIERASAQE